MGRGRLSEGSTAETARRRPERPWTAARTMEVLRWCPLAIAQRLVHCAVAVSTAVLGQSHKDNVRCAAVDEQLGQLEAKEVQLAQPSSTSVYTHDLFWANLKVQLHLPAPSLDLLISPAPFIDKAGLNTTSINVPAWRYLLSFKALLIAILLPRFSRNARVQCLFQVITRPHPGK